MDKNHLDTTYIGLNEMWTKNIGMKKMDKACIGSKNKWTKRFWTNNFWTKKY